MALVFFLTFTIGDWLKGYFEFGLEQFSALVSQGLEAAGTSPMLVSLIVEKAVNMAAMMNIPVLGVVENMSYVKCPDCGKEIRVFGESHLDEVAGKHQLKVLARLPIDPALARVVDQGVVELFEGDWMDSAAETVEALL